ncbi:MAG: hypothetical protein HY343_02740 [Lentisphaerae bacterium]|nr:hypothetical protein [Lentisphaerota bacterium]
MNTRECPSCKSPVADNVDMCGTCGWQLNVGIGKGGASIVRPAVRPKMPCVVQIAFTDDRTGSSDQFKIGIPITVEGILTPVVAKAREVKVWFQVHGDLDEGQDMVLLLDGGSPEDAKKAVQTVDYSGGGDAPEHHLDAVEKLLNTVPWIADPKKARGAIVLLATADSKPARSGKSARQIGEEIKTRGILLYLVCEETPQLRELSDAAGGWLFKISNTPDPKEMQQIAAKVAASITIQAGAGATVPLTAP